MFKLSGTMPLFEVALSTAAMGQYFQWCTTFTWGHRLDWVWWWWTLLDLAFCSLWRLLLWVQVNSKASDNSALNGGHFFLSYGCKTNIKFVIPFVLELPF